MQKVLIVDTDAQMLKLLHAILEKEGFDVRTTLRASTIFKLIHNFKPDTILIDLYIGQFDGKVICREIKMHPGTSNIHIVLMSDTHTNIDPAKYYCDDFIAKPFNTSELVEKLLTVQ